MDERDLSQKVPVVYGSNVFNDKAMRERLPKNVYRSLKQTIEEGKELDPSLADIVANAMKDWAIEKGATHYCHWFQPLTGATAEKHDSFISPTPDGRTIMEFSGKELIQGEPDASSFPSGGLRATFEARGYTAWDCTSPVFIKQDGDNISLFIPSAFCAYKGEALDKKTPLLRSMEAIDKQAKRVLKALGNTTTKHVRSTLGGEQEYFLVDQKFVDKRLDLLLVERTLFGAPSPKGQEMDDHYFGSLDERVASFMNEVNNELWKLGVSAKTQHNEVAPAQYEIAPVFGTVNISTDQNQLTMETLKKVAPRHGFVCLLHEKPFAGLNGSGKHNNWSLSTDDGLNLLEPGVTPHDNMQFLVFLFSVIKAVDKYSGLLRSSVATPGNDHRLGGNEAPPAIVSIFLGDQLGEIFEKFAQGEAPQARSGEVLKLGVNTLPPLPKDNTDRNRTSPFAFTGNKFEFRMPGSSQSLADPNFILNTSVAEVLEEVADELEGATESEINGRVQGILQGFARDHKRVVFNGDNYSQDWVNEAESRGLLNCRSAVEGLLKFKSPENITLLEKYGVLSPTELHARLEILLEEYAKKINIEAMTSLQIVKRQIVPAVMEQTKLYAQTVTALKSAGVEPKAELNLLRQVTNLSNSLAERIDNLERVVEKAAAIEDVEASAKAFRSDVIPVMNEVRAVVDKLEGVVDSKIWPLPTYAEMLFVK